MLDDVFLYLAPELGINVCAKGQWDVAYRLYDGGLVCKGGEAVQAIEQFRVLPWGGDSEDL